MKISLGPILSFRGVTTAGWSLSALIVTDIVIVLSESLFDPRIMKGMESLPETVPNVRAAIAAEDAARRTLRARP